MSFVVFPVTLIHRKITPFLLALTLSQSALHLPIKTAAYSIFNQNYFPLTPALRNLIAPLIQIPQLSINLLNFPGSFAIKMLRLQMRQNIVDFLQIRRLKCTILCSMAQVAHTPHLCSCLIIINLPIINTSPHFLQVPSFRPRKSKFSPSILYISISPKNRKKTIWTDYSNKNAKASKYSEPKSTSLYQVPFVANPESPYAKKEQQFSPAILQELLQMPFF